jgi:DNA modification methylase
MEIKLMNGDCLIKLKELEADSVDSIVTDPPYHLTSITKRFGKENSAPAQYGTDGVFQRASKGFMGKEWDGGDIAFRTEVWEECLRVLKPGGYLLAFGGTRTYHRMTVAIEDSGFEIRDCIFWCYASGFPKSHNIGKAVDKLQGNKRNVVGKNANVRKAEKQKSTIFEGGFKEDGTITKGNSQWEGFGTALKPAVEPVVMARKPFKGSVAGNVLEWGTGAINIDGCRVGHNEPIKVMKPQKGGNKVFGQGGRYEETTELKAEGRWPANLILDEEAGRMLDGQSGNIKGGKPMPPFNGKPKNDINFTSGVKEINRIGYDDNGGASRFFYCPKVSKSERNEGLEDGNTHPTVKPQALMAYLIKLVTPKGGTVLDPFMGSGSTGKAAVKEGYSFIGIEKEEEYFKIAEGRINVEAGPVKILEEFFE